MEKTEYWCVEVHPHQPYRANLTNGAPICLLPHEPQNLLHLHMQVLPEAKPQRMRSAYASEVETSMASLSYYDVLQLRHEDSSINAAMLPFMEKASGNEVPNLHRHPGQFAFVHDRIDALEKSLEGKLDRLLEKQSF